MEGSWRGAFTPVFSTRRLPGLMFPQMIQSGGDDTPLFPENILFRTKFVDDRVLVNFARLQFRRREIPAGSANRENAAARSKKPWQDKYDLIALAVHAIEKIAGVKLRRRFRRPNLHRRGRSPVRKRAPPAKFRRPVAHFIQHKIMVVAVTQFKLLIGVVEAQSRSAWARENQTAFRWTSCAVRRSESNPPSTGVNLSALM